MPETTLTFSQNTPYGIFRCAAYCGPEGEIWITLQPPGADQERNIVLMTADGMLSVWPDPSMADPLMLDHINRALSRLLPMPDLQIEPRNDGTLRLTSVCGGADDQLPCVLDVRNMIH